jgi:hypothetical protein
MFLNLAPTLGRVKSSIPHGAWRFHFFSTFFAKIRSHLNLHIHHWNFCFIKSGFIKNSSRIASVMGNLIIALRTCDAFTHTKGYYIKLKSI